MPTERLATLRRIMYPRPGFSTGATTPRQVLSQSWDPAHPEAVENSIWTEADGRIICGTFHVVGSNNGNLPWGLPGGDRPEMREAEIAARVSANSDQLQQVFAAATATNAAGVLLFQHADMWPAYELATNASIDGFDAWVQQLAAHAAAFARPVWLFNGDTHDFMNIAPFTPGAVHPNTADYGVTDMNLYRIHGETVDAPLFRAITLETEEKYDTPEQDSAYALRLQWEWLEVELHPDTEEVFRLVRHPIFKEGA